MVKNKHIRRRKLRGGTYHSSFFNPKQATEKDLLNLLKKSHHDLGRIFHSPTLCQTIYRFFRARMNEKIGPRTFSRLAKDIINFPVQNLKTPDAIFGFLTVTNYLAHQRYCFNFCRRAALLKKKNEVILYLSQTLPDCFILEKDFLRKEKEEYRWVLKRKINLIDSFHIPNELAVKIRAQNNL